MLLVLLLPPERYVVREFPLPEVAAEVVAPAPAAGAVVPEESSVAPQAWEVLSQAEESVAPLQREASEAEEVLAAEEVSEERAVPRLALQHPLHRVLRLPCSSLRACQSRCLLPTRCLASPVFPECC